MKSTTKKLTTMLSLTAAGTFGLAALATPAMAEDAAGCTTRLLAAESATVGAFGPQPVLEPSVIGVSPGQPGRLAGDTALNAQYFVDCVV